MKISNNCARAAKGMTPAKGARNKCSPCRTTGQLSSFWCIDPAHSLPLWVKRYEKPDTEKGALKACQKWIKL